MTRYKLICPNNYLYIGILLLILKSIIPFSAVIPDIPLVDSVLQYSATLLLVISITKKRYSFRTFMLYLMLTIVSVYCCLQVHEWGMLITVITVLAIRDENFDKIIRFIYQYEMVIFIMHVIISILLLPITNVLSGVYKGQHALVFGFAHKNSFSIILFNLIIMWFWLNYEKVSRKKASYIVILGCILFYLANTRTAIAVLLVFYILFVNASKHGYSKVLEIVSMGIFPALSFMWFAAIKYYSVGYYLLRKVNSLLSDRLVMAAYYYNEVGFSLFGQNVNDIRVVWNPEYNLSGSLTFDSTYSYLLISRGIVFIILCSTIFVLLSRKKSNKINIFIIVWALYSITEAVGLNCFLSFPIMMSVFLFDRNKSGNIKAWG